MKRLPFIRYLYNVAMQQSKQPKPLNAASILTFHDSVELFLHLSCRELDIKVRTDMPFMQYWEALKNLPNGTSLGYKSEMDNLNTLRVNLKHQGIIPAELEIESSRVSANNFFEKSTPIIFGIDFDKISMTDLVQYAPARQALKEATSLKEQKNFGESLYKLAIAFDMIIADYEGRKESRFGKSIFHFGLPVPSLVHFRVDDDTAEFVNKSIGPLQQAMKILSLGLDFRRYSRFRLLVPELIKLRDTAGGIFYPPIEPPQNRKEEHYHFCYDFVIDSAIRIQDFDFDIENP